MLRPLAAVLLLAGCQTQGLRFSDAEPVLVDVEGWRIAVWRSEEDVQAIRMNFIAGATRGEMMAFGRRAVRRATGCRIRTRTVAVNPSVLTGRAACGPAP